MKLIIISAVSCTGVIGVGSEIPWHVPEDFKHFKETTMGHPVVVGLNTFKTLPEKALLGRTYLVLSGDENMSTYQKDNVHFFQSLSSLLDYIKSNYSHLDEEVYIAGGQMIYDQFINNCDECIITWIDKVIPYSSADDVKIFPTIQLVMKYECTFTSDWSTSKKGLNYKIFKYTNKKNHVSI